MTLQVPIPGINPTDPPGVATLREPHEVTERHRRPIKVLMMQMNPARFAGFIGSDDDELPDIEFTEGEAQSFASLADHTIFSALVSWSLDLPLPTSADDCMDIPGHIYDALEKVTSGVGEALKASPGVDVNVTKDADGATVTEAADPFTLGPNTVEDPTSPTGASAD